jgi:hypothetical protein
MKTRMKPAIIDCSYKSLEDVQETPFVGVKCNID